MIRKIVKTATLSSEDVVVEIGCGQGDLSEPLIKIAKHLWIIEIDPDLAAHTQNRLAPYADRLTIINADALKTGFTKIKAPQFKLVANLPYAISSPLMQMFVQNRSRIIDGTIMLQKEFAEKITLDPPNRDITPLTFFCQYFFDVDYQFKVKKNCFKPIPSVDSAILTFKNRPPRLPEPEADLFFMFIKAIFWGKRKPLRSALIKNPHHTFKNLDISTFLKTQGNRRAETLSWDDAIQLYTELKALQAR